MSDTYDDEAIKILREGLPPKRRWLTQEEAVRFAKATGCLTEPPPEEEADRYEYGHLVFDVEGGGSSAIPIWTLISEK